MASIDEYGDMLKWGLPSRDGFCRYFHAYHPGFCSFEDKFRGTIHYHGGEIRGTVLMGHMDHGVYEATPDPEGDRFLDGRAYRLTRHARPQPEGTAYTLGAWVPHWPRPTQITVTYFEEEDNGEMGDLLEPAGVCTDEFHWEQEDAEAFLPSLIRLVEAKLAELAVPA